MAILIWGSFLLLAVLCWATYQSALLLRRMQLDFNLLLIPSENVLKVVLIAVCIWIGLASGVAPEQIGWTTGKGLGEVWLGLVLGLSIWFLSALGTLGAVRVFGSKIYSPALVKSILPRRRREWLLVPLAMLPAVLLEELLFRSLLLGGFSLVLPALIAALIFAVFFGLMHAPQGSLGIVATGLIGMVLSLVFLWRGSLIAPFLAHYLANVLQIISAKKEIDLWH